MNEQNRNPFSPEAPSLPIEANRNGIRHPFFDTPGPQSMLGCLDAINRTACVIDLLKHLNMVDNSLSPKAASGYRGLSETMRDTLKYCARRLQTLDRKQQKQKRRQANYLSALLKSFAILSNVDRDRALNAMAEQLDVTRSSIDAYVDAATKNASEE